MHPSSYQLAHTTKHFHSSIILSPNPILSIMFRAMSRRRGYERLVDEESPSAALVPKLSRTKSLPAAAAALAKANSKKMAQQANKAARVHPFFTLFDTKRKKKEMDLSRYLEYVKEGGAWDKATNKPVMHYT